MALHWQQLVQAVRTCGGGMTCVRTCASLRRPKLAHGMVCTGEMPAVSANWSGCGCHARGRCALVQMARAEECTLYCGFIKGLPCPCLNSGLG